MKKIVYTPGQDTEMDELHKSMMQLSDSFKQRSKFLDKQREDLYKEAMDQKRKIWDAMTSRLNKLGGLPKGFDSDKKAGHRLEVVDDDGTIAASIDDDACDSSLLSALKGLFR